ncbi:unnamed protein product [Prorocentrum cordatum]|uniref:PBZ-type domain-containing protein n=1 Tax=Prorocentrum cordatum TaxID=2364126 RepID=A0ABN9U3G0_9DINO|nr:unnamed protein product [Polarella glacialis]
MGCSASSAPGAPSPAPAPARASSGGAGVVFQFKCPHCTTVLQVSTAGANVQCPICEKVSRVECPPPPAPFNPPARKSLRQMRSTRSFRTGEKTRDMIQGCMDDITRRPCKFGLKCYRRNAEHLDQFLHPDNEDYSLSLWKFRDCRGEFLTLQQCMKFMDPFDKGIVDDKELLGELLKHLQGDGAPAGDDLQEIAAPPGSGIGAIWTSIDDDGNGFVSFAEFIEDWATEFGLGLPVGLDEQNGGSSGSSCAGLKCGYPGCTTGRDRDGMPCISFKPTRNGPSYMCRCRHKRSVHFVQDSLTEIQVPEYWKTAASQDADAAAAELAEWVDVSDQKHHFQALMDNSYKKVWTRDRGRTDDGKQKRVPSGYVVISVQRNENKKFCSCFCNRFFLHRRHQRAEVRRGGSKLQGVRGEDNAGEASAATSPRSSEGPSSRTATSGCCGTARRWRGPARSATRTSSRGTQAVPLARCTARGRGPGGLRRERHEGRRVRQGGERT